MYRNRKYRKSNLGKAKADSSNLSKNENLHRSVLEAIDENNANKINVDQQNLFGGIDDEPLLSSQASVPPSQPPTQRRYLSQKSTLIRTQSKTLQRPPNSYFELVLMKSGADLDQPDAYILSSDHMNFVSRLHNHLKNHQDFPDNLKTFMDGFQETLSSNSNALKLLSGCTINASGSDNIVRSQDSLVMNLLTIDFLQEKIICILMEKTQECAKSDTDEVPLLPLIMSQLKFVSISHGQLLYDKIIEIYEAATENSKKDIILNIEHVIDPNNHDDFVNYLMNNSASSEDLLTKVNIETFTTLSLSSKIYNLLRRRILDYMNEGCPVLMFPVFVKFLLKISNEDAESNINLVTELRRNLKWDTEKEAMADITKSQTEVFSYITQALIRSKKLFDTWQKVISGELPKNAKPIDFVILIILLSIREDKYNILEMIIRRHIKLSHITVPLFRNVKNDFFTILQKHTDTVLHMLHDFLKDKDLMVLNFTKHAYRIVFGIENCDRRRILMKLVEISCEKSSSEHVTLSLEILIELNKKYTTEVQNYGLQLLPILDSINEYNLKQIRMVMELLCSISFPLPPLTECPMLQDHIDMLVKKQVISASFITRKQGIIGIVQLVDHIIRTEKECDRNIYDLDQTLDSCDDLPDGRGKLAASYINRIFATTTYCPESLALFYDEMATVLSPKNKNRDKTVRVDRYFLVWFCDLVTNHFQNNFVVEEVPTGLNMELSYQNCINSPEEQSEPDIVPIAINIGGSVLTSSSDATSSIAILPSLFNLTRVLHFTRYEGSLESINAVLGCAVLLPTAIDPAFDRSFFDKYDETKSRKILDMHFYTANWYREAIGSFASQDDPMIRRKILLRMSELIKLEDKIRKLLLRAPNDYSPPVCHFLEMEIKPSSFVFKKPTGRPKRAAKEKDDKSKNTTLNSHGGETEGMSMLGTVRSQNTTANNSRLNPGKAKTTSKKLKFELNYGQQETYRQLDPDIMLILREEVKPIFPLPEDKVGTCMGLLEFRFIMTDLICKLESVTGVKKFENDHTLQYINYPFDLISDLVHFIPKVINVFEQFSIRLNQAVKSVDGALGNMNLFTDELNYLKVCYGLCLRFFAALLTWTGFDDEQNEKLLKEALRGINGYSLFSTTASKSLVELVCMAFEKFSAVANYTIDIKSAVQLYHLIGGLKKFSENKISDKSIASVCKKFMLRKWYDFDATMEKGASANILLDKLLKGFLQNVELKTLREILKVVLSEVKFLRKTDDCLRTFPNIHKANFPMLYKNLCEALHNSINWTMVASLQTIKGWEMSLEVLNMLLQIVKSLEMPRNFSLFLKYGHLFLKLFLSHGLPVFETNLRKNPEQINELLKSLQPPITFLHNLSCHSKAIKNTAIVTQIPFVRETIENIVFRVKAALAANNCSSVFWMRVFKNKDLQGDEIASQTSSQTATHDPDDDEEEDLPDDNSIDETILAGVHRRSSTSAQHTKSNSNGASSRSKCF